MSFFAQHQLESLNINNTLLDELKEQGSDKSETELRSILGCFLFSNDDVFKKIKVLSGGEKSRVAMAKTLISEANFLLLDEPTNHLDIQSVNILTQALDQYEGSYVVISHDRHFVSQVANKIWYIEDFQLKEYPGTYDEYTYWMEKKTKDNKDVKRPEPIVKKAPAVTQNSKPSDDTARILKAANSRIEKVEEKINQLEQEKKNLEELLGQPKLYEDKILLEQTKITYQTTKDALEIEQKSWDTLALEIETLEKQLS